MTELALSSRFQLLETPLTAPGKCMVCGSVDRPVVDFGADIQFYGAVYFCGTCICEAAAIFGMVPRTELEAAERESVQSFAETLNNNNLVAVSGEWFAVATALFGSIPVLNVNTLLDSDDESAGQAGEEVSEESGSDSGESNSNEPDEFSGIFGDAEPSGQDSDTPVDEGPASVSASSSNESGSNVFGL